ncbi:hypothetical protein BpHYR1_020056 [Brachionus plicatilis]|uniref:Uncharacterized protein n=1 Tax=Brachionus plicatilis TaxID=10195 RepID=A0A3M7QYR1_BRAPC|nr:hypothetical protein BpHYR1_020056 [Brachionus plicatilis]
MLATQFLSSVCLLVFAFQSILIAYLFVDFYLTRLLVSNGLITIRDYLTTYRYQGSTLRAIQNNLNRYDDLLCVWREGMWDDECSS